tara:strand:- start:3596 stop:4342 length:747 start_codon:yes stop_codon:yes gene_type:complete
MLLLKNTNCLILIKAMKNKLLFYFQFFLKSINYLFNKGFNENNVIKSISGDELVIFDVGSNTGLFVKNVSKNLKNKKIDFHSFEPDKELCRLQKNIKIPKNQKLNINNLAISNVIEPKKFYERSISSHSSLYENPQIDGLSSVKRVYEIDATTLDQYCIEHEIEKIDLLKIDVEGHDFNVLLSSKSLLKENKIKLIKVEIFTNNQTLTNIFSTLESFNYRLIGTTNNSFFNKELKFFDAYFASSDYVV